MLYGLIVGMLVPLKTGIIQISPITAKSGESISFNIKGYNSSYHKQSENIRIWFKLDSLYTIKANTIEVQSPTNLKANFVFPSQLPTTQAQQELTLVLEHPTDGTSVLPSAAFITAPAENDSLKSIQAWTKTPMENLIQSEKFTFPYRGILGETIRNTFYHVPLWFAMMLILLLSMLQSIFYLKNNTVIHDEKANAYAQIGLLYGILGLVTGAIWAKYTWGAYWSFDPKQNMSAIAMLIYLAYFVLRGSFEDDEKKARISAIYNIFAFVMLIPLLFIIPRMVESLHPGNGGNPGLGADDLDSTMRMIFYPTIIGFMLFGLWLSQLVYRKLAIERQLLEEE